MEYPTAPRLDVTERLHGVPVPDPYRWLEDYSDPRTRAWQLAQEAIFAQARAGWKHVDAWQDALTAAFRFDVVSAPKFRGDRTFLTQLRAGEEHPVLMVCENGVRRPLLDPLAIDPTGGTVLEAWEPSADGLLLAYQLSSGGNEDGVLWVLDVATGEHRGPPIDRVRRSTVAWLPGGDAFYYVRSLNSERNLSGVRYHRRVYLHQVGSDPANDVLIFGEGRSKTQFYTVSLTPDGRWLVITATVGTAPATELWLADLHASLATSPNLSLLSVDQPARSSVRIVPGTSSGERIWLRTDLEAPRGRVVITTTSDLESTSWRTLIPEREDAVLEDFVPLTGEALSRPLGLVSWSRHAVFELTVHDLTDGRELARPVLPGAGRIAAMTAAPEYGHQAWFTYTDYTSPPQVLRYDALTGEVIPWASTSATGGGQPVGTCQVNFRSHDGTTVQMFIIAPSCIPDRPRPTVLTGYGGFGQSMFPTYLPLAVTWARSGGVFAVACLRGGAEEGRAWHLAGTGVNKQRTLDDFDAAADYLVTHGWSTPDKLGAFGQSNGGLVVSAAATQHPERYAAVACLAPLADMVRYERSGMGPSWRPEYGSVQNPDEFHALFAYSPYHRVRTGITYPAFLVGAFEADSRVDPAHARKLTAALQDASRGQCVVFRLEKGTGHGARATSLTIGVFADVLAFLGHYLDLDPAGSS